MYRCSWNRFVAVLFIDALQRMIRIAQEGELYDIIEACIADSAGTVAKQKADMADVRTETN